MVSQFRIFRVIVLTLACSVIFPAGALSSPLITRVAHGLKNLILRKNKVAEAHRAEVRIAVLRIRGGIFNETELVKKLYKIRTDDSIHGVLLQVSSGGGAPGASWLISKEIAACSKKKPVVVVIGDICASGAMLAVAWADFIFAPNIAEIGSIGVLYMVCKNKVEKFEDEVAGVSGEATIEVIASSPNKIVTNPFGPNLSDEQRAALTKYAHHLYEIFYQEIAQARKLDPEKHLEWADAQMFSGEQALALGLIDGLGSYSDAIEKLLGLIKERLQVEGKPVLIEVES